METRDLNKRVVIATGGFDPVHSGHIAYLKAARSLGERLVVGLNSDEWLIRKKGKFLLTFVERAAVLSSFSFVDEVIQFDDSDGTAIDCIKQCKERFPANMIVFANGGDRTATNIPEMTEKDVIFTFGVGGNFKANSSSWILNSWADTRVHREWGTYEVLKTLPGQKIKLLTVEPSKSLSMQRHQHRAEYWYVLSGKGYVDLDATALELTTGKSVMIPAEHWHKLVNDGTEPLVILETQIGPICDESDIVRA